MKKTRLLFSLFVVCASLKAQTPYANFKDINREIWQPFIEAYATLNVEKYKNLETEDFIRAEGNSKSLPSHKEYFDNVAKWFADLKAEGRKLAIDFRFIERIATSETASEVGIYELKTIDSTGIVTWKGYGKFHVFLKKVKGVWKIVVDYDSYENGTISEQSFKSANDMNDFEKY